MDNPDWAFAITVIAITAFGCSLFAFFNTKGQDETIKGLEAEAKYREQQSHERYWELKHQVDALGDYMNVEYQRPHQASGKWDAKT